MDEGLEDRKKRVSLVSHNSHSVHTGYPAERGGGGSAVRENSVRGGRRGEKWGEVV